MKPMWVPSHTACRRSRLSRVNARSFMAKRRACSSVTAATVYGCSNPMDSSRMPTTTPSSVFRINPIAACPITAVSMIGMRPVPRRLACRTHAEVRSTRRQLAGANCCARLPIHFRMILRLPSASRSEITSGTPSIGTGPAGSMKRTFQEALVNRRCSQSKKVLVDFQEPGILCPALLFYPLDMRSIMKFNSVMNSSLTTQLANCECCPRNCKIDRLDGQSGFCRVRADVQVSHIGLHFGEEPPISGTKGSGTVFFAGCNLRCVFCQNYQISQEFRQEYTRTLTTNELVSEMLRLQDMGAHNVNFVSPSHMIFQMAEAIQAARGRGLTIPIVYNTNGYDSVDALRQIRGLIDIYLPDIKYLDNGLGKQFSAARDYAEVIPEVLREMLAQVGHLEMDEDGIAVRGLLVRHLVLPNHLENSRRCLRFLKELSPDTFVSIMSQYSPQYKAARYPAINRRLTQAEYDEITDYALDLGLENAFVQELESQEQCVPDFEQERPFKFE